MYGVSPQAYDRAITVFSPDGRLFQVEYAKEAVKRGATSIGIKTKDSVILVAIKVLYSKLVEDSSIKKIFKVDDHLFLTASGLIADVRKLVDLAREESNKHRLIYNEPVPVISSVKYVADIMQLFTQYGGARPFGVSLLVAGYDSKPYLYEIEPSGSYTGYYAHSIGEHKKEVEALLLKKYKENMTFKDAIKLSVDILKKVETNWKNKTLEIAYINKETKKFKFLPKKEIDKYMSKLVERK